MHDSLFEQVTIVCVTYQSHALVGSLAATLRPFPHVLVIDNDSQDGTASALRELLPHARIIERTDNGGFGKANNEAMAQVKTPLALLLNPDCDIKPDGLQTLMDTLRLYPSAGIVAPQSWRGPQRPQKSFRPAFYEASLKAPYQLADGTCSAQWVHGCCLLMRTDAFRHIGGFDERFFLFYEDDDLCLRMQKAGFECLLEPAANALHAGGTSSTPSLRTSFTRSFHYARSRHLAICKYQGNGAGRRYLLKIILAALPLVPVYALLLQRRHLVKWAAWGYSAATSALARPAPVREPVLRPRLVETPADSRIVPGPDPHGPDSSATTRLARTARM